jgi:serine/threonine protein kinase
VLASLSTGLPLILANRFEPERPLREGFATSTWLARDLETGGLAVVKTLHRDMRRERVVAEWFAEQPALLARLDHPSVVRLLHDGSGDEPPFFATEHLPGGSLEDLLAGGRHLGEREVARMALEVLGALEHAHAHGVLHGGLKPGNILFDGHGHACLTDFGPSREQLRAITMVGSTAGASMFLAPEQGAIPVPLGVGTDLYALGAIALHALTRGSPLALLGPDRDAELAKVREPLRGVLDRATRPDLSARFGSAREMAAALRDAVGVTSPER